MVKSSYLSAGRARAHGRFLVAARGRFLCLIGTISATLSEWLKGVGFDSFTVNAGTISITLKSPYFYELFT